MAIFEYIIRIIIVYVGKVQLGNSNWPSVQLNLESAIICRQTSVGLVTQPFKTVAEDVFIWAVGPTCSVNFHNHINAVETSYLMCEQLAKGSTRVRSHREQKLQSPVASLTPNNYGSSMQLCALQTQRDLSELGFLKSRSYFPSLQNSEAATSIPISILPV